MKFIKKPLIIEAMQWEATFKSYHEICTFFDKSFQNNHCGQIEPQEIYIETLEGTMTAKAGDWIIKGIKGELYPCRNDIFLESYQEWIE